MCVVSQPGFVYSMMTEDGKTNRPKPCKSLFQKFYMGSNIDILEDHNFFHEKKYKTNHDFTTRLYDMMICLVFQCPE